MVRGLSGAFAAAALALLLVGTASGERTSADRYGPDLTPEERLELDFGALQDVFDRFKRPTVGQFLRGLVQVHKPDSASAPSFTWVRTKRQLNNAFKSVEYYDCSRCSLVIAPGNPRAPHRRSSVIRPGALLAGSSEEGKLFCVGPTDPEAHSCRES